MCTPDASTLAAVPRLTAANSTTLLQSFAHHRKGKYKGTHHAWLADEVFARQTWQEYGCSEEEAARVHADFCAFFGVREASPSPHSLMGDTAASVFASWQDGARELTFFTSGSTGRPKGCTHSEDFLRQELTGVLPLLHALPPRTGALVTVPVHHLYGFTFGLLLPQALGLVTRTESPLPTAIARQIQPNDVVIGIPLLWAHMAQLRTLPCTQALLFSATAPLEDATLGLLRGKGFDFIEIFGSSETGAMGWRGEAGAPFHLFPHFTRFGDNDTVLIQRNLPQGGIHRLPLQDSLHWHSDRSFTAIGRKDHAVQVGGVNVYPARVAAVLQTQPGVRECQVRLMRPDEGQRLKAFIVPEQGDSPQTLRAELRAYAKQHLTAEEQPARFDFGAELPRSSLGKLADWAPKESL